MISGVSGAPAQSTSCTSGGSCARGAQQVGQALLAGDPPDEDDRGPVGVDAVAADDVVVLGAALPQLGVDAVVDDVDPAGSTAG